jgi:hypothetical protein
MNDTTPPDVKKFEIAALASLALSIPSVIIGGLSRTADAPNQLTLNDFLFAVVFAGAVALLVLTASRRGSNGARWVFVALTLASLATVAWMPSLVTDDGVIAGILYVAQFALDLAACFFLFTPQSRAWFAGTGDIATRR